MSHKRLITSIVLNSINIILVAICSVFMLLNFNFMGIEGSLTPDSTSLLAYFTVDSNLLLMLCSILFLVFEILLLTHKLDKIPFIAYILKYISTCAVGLTFATITFVFAPMFKENFWMLYLNNNLIFHLVVPVIAIIVFVGFEYSGEFKFKHTFLGFVPAGIYALYYTLNVVIHMNPDGTVPTEYDIYGFAQNGLGGIVFSFTGMLVLAYLISFLIYLFAGLINKRRKKIE